MPSAHPSVAADPAVSRGRPRVPARIRGRSWRGRRRSAGLVAILGWALVVLSAVAVSTAGPASAAPASASTSTTAPKGAKPAASAPTQLWALAPASPDPSQPSNRTTFSYVVARGATVTDKVEIYNYGSQPAPFELYATDALDSAEGQLAILRSDQRPTDVGTWVHLLERYVIVQPGHAETVPFTVTVPAHATPGDHTGGLVASIETPQTDPTGHQVLVQHQIVVPVYTRVAGRLRPELSVEDVHTSYHPSIGSLGPGRIQVTYTVHNSGNIRLAGHQQVSATGPLGWTLAQRKLADVPELLPGASVQRSVTLDGVFPALWVTGQITIHPFSTSGPVQPPPPTTSGSAWTWAVPWLWLLVVAAVIGYLVWRRRRRRSRPPVPPVAGAPGVSDPGGRGDGTGEVSEPTAELVGGSASSGASDTSSPTA